jgi:hypothetical protein
MSQKAEIEFPIYEVQIVGEKGTQYMTLEKVHHLNSDHVGTVTLTGNSIPTSDLKVEKLSVDEKEELLRRTASE